MSEIRDDKILAFLRAAYFGNISEPFSAASNRAYRDMCRTIKFNNKVDFRVDLRNNVCQLLKTEITNSPYNEILNASDFDKWHRKVCKKIKDIYFKPYNIVLTYGQAQKWLNMTIKYLYVLGESPLESAFAYLHAPIDKIVFEKSGVAKPNVTWSSWDKYDEYLNYQKELRKKYGNPFIWEFGFWTNFVKNGKS